MSGGLGVSASPCRPVLRPVAAWDRQPPTRCHLGQDGARAQRGTAGRLNAGYGRDAGPPCTPPERELDLRTEDTKGLSPCLGMYASRLVLGTESSTLSGTHQGVASGRTHQPGAAIHECRCEWRVPNARVCWRPGFRSLSKHAAASTAPVLCPTERRCCCSRPLGEALCSSRRRRDDAALLPSQ